MFRRRFAEIYAALCGLALIGSFAYVSFGAPPAQREAGAWAQKIFYFHVSSAEVAMALLFGGMMAGVGYLAWKDPRVHRAGHAMIEVGWFASTLVLCTGPVWAYPVWGVAWSWSEPRLTTFAFLWFAYAAYMVLGPAIPDREKRRTLQSVYAILASASVPLVVYSTRFVPPDRQAHPDRIDLTGEMKIAWASATVALTLLFAGAVYLRYRIEHLSDLVQDLEARGHA